MFKVGDRVFNYQYGWGTINEELTKYILVLFDNCKSVSIPFYKDGKETSRSERPTLSFTEYTLEGFSQERPKHLGVPIPLKVEKVDIKKLWNTCEDFIDFLDIQQNLIFFILFNQNICLVDFVSIFTIIIIISLYVLS